MRVSEEEREAEDGYGSLVSDRKRAVRVFWSVGSVLLFCEMSGGGCSIVWFRRDLRVEDNPALTAAVRSGAVVAVFIWAPEEEGHYYPGRVSRWWLKQSLALLDSSLRSLGTFLVTKRSTNTISALLDVFKATGASQLFFNHLYGLFFASISNPYLNRFFNFSRLLVCLFI